MIRSITLTLAVAAVLVAVPASAQPFCPQYGDTVCLNLLPLSDTSGPYCMVDSSGNGVVPALLEADAALVKWRVNSSCEGEYTVLIVPDSTKANTTAALPCSPEKTYQGQVHDDESLLCPISSAGKYGYHVAVCPPKGDCRCTDPGIWINNKNPTVAQRDASKKETMTVRTCTRDEIEKRRAAAPAAKKAPPKPEPKRQD
jgi:hypothetical protein